MKPAEQSSVIAAKLMEIFREVGPAAGRAQLPAGPAARWSAPALVEHPDVALIAFTGSRPVGLAINATAAEVSDAAARRRQARDRRNGRQERDHRR